MRIFISGATGAIGREVLPLLTGEGHDVTAVARTAERAAQVERAGARPVHVNVFDRDAVRKAVRGHDVVINLATHIPKSMTAVFLPWSWRENDRLRRDASRNLAVAAAEAGADRFIQESFGLTYPDRGSEWITEDVPLAPAPHTRTVLDAEGAAAEFGRSGGVGIVLRFAGFHLRGKGMERQLEDAVRRGWSPLPGDPEGYLSFVDIGDAARAVVAALRAPAGTYNVVDDAPVRRRELVEVTALRLGVRPPKPMPGWMVRLTGSVGEVLARSVRMSNRRLKEATGWGPVVTVFGSPRRDRIHSPGSRTAGDGSSRIEVDRVVAG